MALSQSGDQEKINWWVDYCSNYEKADQKVYELLSEKEDLEEEGYRPTIEISADSVDEQVFIKFQDNGIGVKKENVEKLFTPFFTTKATSKKGTGLGLYVIRQLIEENHEGKVEFTSVYKQGSRTKLTFKFDSNKSF